MQYQIKAVDAGKGIISMLLEAPSVDAARQAAEHQGLRVMSMIPTRRLSALGTAFGRRQEFPLALFSQELATLINAGLSLVNAIESLAEKEEQASTRKVLTDLSRLLYEGKSFSQSLGHFPAVFPDLYVALIQSSERTGALGDGLSRYVAYRARIELLKQKMIGASVYPALLFLVGGGVLLFLLGYVVPRFSAVFGDLGTRLPWMSRALLMMGQGIHDHIEALALAAALAVVAAAMLLRMEAVRRSLGQVLVAVPAIRQRVFLYEVTRFYRSLGILLQSGIPILAAIGMARGLVGAGMRHRLDNAARRVSEGLPVSQALELNHLSTPVAMRMLHAGEQAGNLGAMMERTADFYDEEMSRWIEWFVRLFEPLLMVFVGAVIGVVVILMYMPIFELAGSIR